MHRLEEVQVVAVEQSLGFDVGLAPLGLVSLVAAKPLMDPTSDTTKRAPECRYDERKERKR